MLFELTFNYDFGQALNKYTYSSKYQWKVKDLYFLYNKKPT